MVLDSTPGACRTPGTRPASWQTLAWTFQLRTLQAYKSFYDAAVFCLENGGFLAERIEDVDQALKFCKYLRGDRG